MTLHENLGMEHENQVQFFHLQYLKCLVFCFLFQSFLRVCVSTLTAGLRSSWASLQSSPTCSSSTLTSLRSPRTCLSARLTSPTSHRSVCCHERWWLRKSRGFLVFLTNLPGTLQGNWIIKSEFTFPLQTIVL